MKKTAKGYYTDVHNGHNFEVWKYTTWSGEMVWTFNYEWDTMWNQPSESYRSKKIAEAQARQEIDRVKKEWNEKRAERMQRK